MVLVERGGQVLVCCMHKRQDHTQRHRAWSVFTCDSVHKRERCSQHSLHRMSLSAFGHLVLWSGPGLCVRARLGSHKR
jgi:hypothetical protein